MLGCELLLGAADLVARGWVQGTDAVDANGTPVEPWSQSAVGWSLLGALVAALQRRTPAGGPPPVGELAAACVALVEYVDHDLLDVWNDDPHRTQADVLAALRAAIEEARNPGHAWN
jgi:hypothetical protein